MVGMAPLSLLSNVSNKSVDCDDLCLLKPNEKAGCVWPLGISPVFHSSGHTAGSGNQPPS